MLNFRARYVGLALALPLALIFGCSGSDSNPLGSGASTSRMIGVGGGSISLEGTTLTIPGGALGAAQMITVTSSKQRPPAGVKSWSSPLFTFQPEGLRFQRPITATFTSSGNASLPTLYWTDEGATNLFRDAGGARSGHLVAAQIDHFSSGFVAPAATCGALVDTAPIHRELLLDQAAPTPQGGSVVGGRYHRVATTRYTGTGGATGSGGTIQQTIEVVTTSSTTATVSWVSDSARQGAADVQLSSTALVLTATCGGFGSRTYQYTATPTTITVFDAIGADTQALSFELVAPGADLAVPTVADLATPAPSDMAVGADLASSASAPVITSLVPRGASQGDTTLTVTISGQGFVAGSIARWNTTALSTTFVSANSLTAVVTTALLAVAGSYDITVDNGGAAGGISAPVAFVVGAVNPAPTLTAISPTSIIAGAGNTQITLTGTGFTQVGGARFGTTALATTFVSATSATATIPSTQLGAPGAVNVTYVNPTPGGGTSAAQTFTINPVPNNPLPVITSISPSEVHTGANDVVWTLQLQAGTALAGSTVQMNGVDLPTDTSNAASGILRAHPGASTLFSNPQTLSVTVTNPTPGGGTSAIAPYAVVTTGNPVPLVGGGMTPATVIAGASNTTLTFTGTGFVNGMVFSAGLFPNDVTLAAASVTATQATVVIPAAMLTTPGDLYLFPVNLTPGGGPGQTNLLTIQSATPNPVPTLTSMSPSTLPAGSSSTTVTFTGTGFAVDGSISTQASISNVKIVSSTQATALLLASNMTSAGMLSFNFFNRVPGGGTSNAVTLAVTTPTPVIQSVTPAEAGAGSANLTIQVMVQAGSALGTASVRLDGTNVSTDTSTVGSGLLRAVIPAAQMTGAGAHLITVLNPGGTPSATQPFNVVTSGNAVPVLTSIAPTMVTAGSGNTTVTFTGTGFVAGATVLMNGPFGTSAAATVTSATSATAVVPSSLLGKPGSRSLVFINGAPGGGASNSLTLQVQ